MQDNTQIENAVLGALLVDGQKIYDAMSIVREEDFALSSNRTIFRAMLKLAESGEPIDIISVAGKLGPELPKIGNYSYLAGLSEGIGGNVTNYARTVRELSRKRRFAALCERAMSQVQDGESIEDSLCELDEGMLSLRADASKAQAKIVGERIGDVLQRIINLRDRRDEVVGFTTGITDLDNSTTGIRPGEIWMVGALPGRGKTSLGLQIAIANSQRKVPTAIFSLEMAEEQLLQRTLSAVSGVSALKIRNPKWLDATDMRDIETAAGEVMEWPLYIDESSSLTTQELAARARLYKRRFGVHLIVVDYLRLIDASGRELRERVGNAANTLRQLAKDEKIAVVALSQLRRPQDINDRPSMVDLKESGDIEAHAHTVLLLYQPVDKQGQFVGEDEIIIGKQRNGPLGTVPVYFNKKRLMFELRSLGQ